MRRESTTGRWVVVVAAAMPYLVFGLVSLRYLGSTGLPETALVARVTTQDAVVLQADQETVECAFGQPKVGAEFREGPRWSPSREAI